MVRTIDAGGLSIGPGSGRITLIAGPCVAESRQLCLEIAHAAKEAATQAGLGYVFKASFDKANRTSYSSYRGPGMAQGLEILAEVASRFGVPTLTDIHEPSQAVPAAETVDILQIPAFLSRQTDLLAAAARTERCVNVKKAQFMAPWDMKQAIGKLVECGATNILLTERGSSFGYNTLVVDMCSLPTMRNLGYPVCMDATHGVQQPGASGTQSGGHREHVPHLARAAAAVGIDALFLEVHPTPERGLSDSATMLRLADLPALLSEVAAIDSVVRSNRLQTD